MMLRTMRLNRLVNRTSALNRAYLPLPAQFSTTHPRSLASTEPLPEDAEEATDEEKSVLKKLQSNFHGAEISIQDVSGGCGSFYAISIRHDTFKGLSTIKQHQSVNKVLVEELQKWHGVQLKTMSSDT